MAKETGVPVIAFEALHEGVSHDVGLATSDDLFGGLLRKLELAVGAPVILTHNLAVEYGLINGSQGAVIAIIYLPGNHPNHDSVQKRMPMCVLVNFNDYTGPAFLQMNRNEHGYLYWRDCAAMTAIKEVLVCNFLWFWHSL